MGEREEAIYPAASSFVEVEDQIRKNAFNKIKNIETLVDAFLTLGSCEKYHSMSVRDKTAMTLIQMQKYRPDLIPKGTNIEDIVLGAWFHDIGKLMTPNSILGKPAKFTDDEFDIMKEHTLYSEEALSSVKELGARKEIPQIALSHHEALDGSGYPNNITANEISFGAKVIRLIDCYDAMRMNRPYRVGMSPEDAIKNLAKDMNSGKIDKELFEFFILAKPTIELAVPKMPIARDKVKLISDVRRLLDGNQLEKHKKYNMIPLNKKKYQKLEKFRFVYTPIFKDANGTIEKDFGLKFGDRTSTKDDWVEFSAKSLLDAQNQWEKYKENSLHHGSFYFFGQELSCTDLKIKEISIARQLPLYHKGKSSDKNSIEDLLKLQLVNEKNEVIAEGTGDFWRDPTSPLGMALKHCDEKAQDITFKDISRGSVPEITMFGKPVYIRVADNFDPKNLNSEICRFAMFLDRFPELTISQVYYGIYDNVSHETIPFNPRGISEEIAFAALSYPGNEKMFEKLNNEDFVKLVLKATDKMIGEADRHATPSIICNNMHNVITCAQHTSPRNGVLEVKLPEPIQIESDIINGRGQEYVSALKEIVRTNPDIRMDAAILLRQVDGDLKPAELKRSPKDFDPVERREKKEKTTRKEIGLSETSIEEQKYRQNNQRKNGTGHGEGDGMPSM